MRLYLLALFLATVLSPQPLHAISGPWQRDNDIGVRLIAGVNGTGDLAEIPLGLDIDLEPGWHTYWRSPGETGLPPKIDWGNSFSTSGNLESANILYPAPVRIDEQGITAIGYNDDVLLPITARVRSPGKPLAIEASVDLLICKQICLPKHFTLKLDIPAGKASPSSEADYINKWQARVPGNEQQSGISIIDVQRNPEEIFITFTRSQDRITPDIFVENENNIMFAKPVLQDLRPDTVSFILKPIGNLPDGISLKTLPVTITIIDGDKALEKRLDESFSLPSPPSNAKATQTTVPTSKKPPLWIFVVMAILGGFILNLTPCVLPVLSLKILSVISHGGGEKSTVRRSFLTTAAGIVFSFIVLALFTVLLKETGRAVGWGMQFQQPAFLVFLILLLTLFAANLWDLFEITLPRFLADRFDPLYHPKIAGDFLTGAFATLMATPCSVPFLGTAIGFALAAGTMEIIIVFIALGIGMSLPYLAVAWWPRLAILLPRPGHWMITLRRILGGALALTAAWLLYVLRSEITLYGTIAVFLCMLAIIGVLYLYRRKSWNNIGRVVILIFIMLAFILSLTAKAPVEEVARAKNTAWLDFDESAIDKYVREGKTVFVDVTADWCVNCKANKQFTLNREDVKRCLFGRNGIVAMRADWTNPNNSISSFLRRHKRYGIPFNVIFGPSAPQGIVLPELLTPDAVTEGLKKATGKPLGC